ncbi:MAG: DUF4956 domain-containing protein [Bacteroidales bacterium]|nr:DUF4956 domain-containing protein [Bacteroidales bacterium]
MMLSTLLLLADDAVRLLGIKLINTHDFLELIIRFSFNILIVFILVRKIYFPVSRRKEYYFNYMLISVILFLMTYMLINVKDLSVGVALGLFALFGILRFRTAQIPIKEMTYLFLVIGLSVINALVTKKISYAEMLFINIIVLLAAWLGERFWISNRMSRKTVTYEKIELIKPENRQKLIADLRERTGLDITRVEIGKIDFLRDVAQIRIFYTHHEQFPYLEEEEDAITDNGD